MITIYPAENRASANHGWLRTWHSFSFADYYDPNNTQFGPLVVFNDDLINPETGFGTHPHRDMEIVSVVLNGQLQHKDSMGNTSVIKKGEIQRMTAGTGVRHSEWNPTSNEVTNLLQIWFFPNQQGLPPSYEQVAYDLEKMRNNWLPIVSQDKKPEMATLHQDLTLYLSEIEEGKTMNFTQKEGRRIYLFVMEGEVQLNGEQVLKRRDAARITDVHDIQVKAEEETFVMLIDLP